MSTSIEKPKLIYHYCDLDGFLSILQGRCIRLTNLNFMNDFVEHNHFLEFVRKKIKDFEIADWDIPSRSGGMASVASEILIHGIDAFMGPYAACFSENGDLLGQWRAYAGNGSGVAIGFRLDGFRLSEEPEKVVRNVLTGDGLSFHKIAYDEAAMKAVLEEIVDRFKAHPNPTSQDGWISFLDDIDLQRPLFKHPAFVEEAEWRIVAHPRQWWFIEQNQDGSNQLRREDWPNYEAQKFCVSGSNLVPFFEFQFDREAVAEIILGPRRRREQAKDSVMYFLASSGYKPFQIEIRHSVIPYRG